MLRSMPLWCLWFALPICAQDKGEPAAAKVATGPPPVVVTLSFAGGTLAEFCQLIRQKEPKANIVVASAAADATLPAIELRGAGLDQALEGACAIAESGYAIRMKDFRGPGEPVYTVLAVAPATSAPGAKAEGTQVFSLGRITDDAARGIGLNATTVLSAVEAAVGGQNALAALQYHRDSGLMIVRGSPERLAIVGDVLRNLEKDVEARRRAENARKGQVPAPAEDQKK